MSSTSTRSKNQDGLSKALSCRMCTLYSLPRSTASKVKMSSCQQLLTVSASRYSVRWMTTHVENNFGLHLRSYAIGVAWQEWASEGFFPGGPKMERFHFAHSKLSKQPLFAKTLIGKSKISKSRGGLNPFCLPPSDEHVSKHAVVYISNAAESWKRI